MRRRIRRLRIARLGVVVLLGCAVSSVALGEVYRWTDERGRMHFTHDLSQVPPAHRAQAEAAAREKSGPSRVQTFEAPPARRAVERKASQSKGSIGETVRVRVQRAGNSMRVFVVLNDRVTVPFIIDTGASDVVVPERFVQELGIDLDGVRTGRYSTANGVVEHKLITLDSVDLQGARAEGVPAAVSPNMEVGLLGLSYFNRFQYQFDPAQGVVSLTPNGLEEAGLIRGGRSEADWRSEFAQIAARRRMLERERDETPWTRARARERLEERDEELDRQRRALEREADSAQVPYSWRE